MVWNATRFDARLRLAATLFLLLTVGVAVVGKVRGEETSPTAPGAQQIVLRVGDESEIGPLGYRLKVSGISEDSRCPASVLCVWSGQAVIDVEITAPDGSVQTPRFSTIPVQVGVQTVMAVNAGGTCIRLASVSPYPLTTTPIPVTDYEITFDLNIVESTGVDACVPGGR